MSSFRCFRAANHAACARSRARCLANYNRIGPGTLEAADGPADAWVASRSGLSGPDSTALEQVEGVAGEDAADAPGEVVDLAGPVPDAGDQPQGEDDGAGHTGGGGVSVGQLGSGPSSPRTCWVVVSWPAPVHSVARRHRRRLELELLLRDAARSAEEEEG